MVWCTIGGHLWNLAILAALNTSSFTTVSLVNHFNCQVQKPSSYPLKLVVGRCHHWQSFDRRGKSHRHADFLGFGKLLSSQKAKMDWSPSSVSEPHCLWGTGPKSGSQISLRLCSSCCCCFTRGRENVSAVISESEQRPHRVGRSLISSGKVKELKLDEGRMKRNVTAEESSDTDRRALLKSGRQLWHHQTINNQRIDRSRPQSCPAFRVQMMLRQHSSCRLWGS